MICALVGIVSFIFVIGIIVNIKVVLNIYVIFFYQHGFWIIIEDLGGVLGLYFCLVC